MNLNRVFVLGNLTKDPELRATPSGTAVCSFNVATNRHFITTDGKKVQEPEYHAVVAWGKQAEIIHQYLKKGGLLLVEGRLQTRDWVDDKGVKHWKTEIVAERLQLGPKITKKTEPMGEIIAAPAEEPLSQTAAVAA
jgi:single-strand DNA-binding protein